MPHFIKTGFWALEKKGYNGWLKLEDIIGGGSSGVVEVTYTALQTLISSSALSPGTIYKITGFNKNMPIGGPSNPNGFLPEVLYDDGTNAGVTIYMQALTKNTLSNDGHGEFYNPVYGDQTTYNNTDGTGLYGIWDGDNPDPLEVPAYVIDQVVFWGGYAWRNVTGNVGTADNIITLSADWEKLPYYNSPYYELVIDAISVDWDNGIVIRRTNVENQITVEFNADQYWWWMGLFNYFTGLQTNPISVMAWGLYSKVTPEQLDNDFYGISNLRIINSNCETVNFKGDALLNIDMDSSHFFNNYMGRGCYIDEIIIKSFSSIRNNILTDNSYIYSITLEHNGNINSNTLGNNSAIDNNTLTINSFIQGNTLDGGSYIQNNTLTNGSGIDNNTLSNSSSIQNNTIITYRGSINNNTLDSGSTIDNNILDSSGIIGNTLNNGNIIGNALNNGIINNNTLDNGSGINGNTLDNGGITSNTLDNGGIISNTLTNSCIINENELTSGNIKFNTLTNNSTINENKLNNDCNINNNTLDNNSNITGNTLDDGSGIDFNTLQVSSIINTDFRAADFISNNNLNSSTFIFTNLDGAVQFNNVYNSSLSEDLSTAIHIYAAYYKQIFQRPDATIRLGYYNNSDVFTAVAVNA